MLVFPKVQCLRPVFWFYLLTDFIHQSPNLVTALPLMPLPISPYPTLLLSRRLTTSIGIVPFLGHHLFPISNESRLRALLDNFFSYSETPMLSIALRLLQYSPQLDFDSIFPLYWVTFITALVHKIFLLFFPRANIYHSYCEKICFLFHTLPLFIPAHVLFLSGTSKQLDR